MTAIDLSISQPVPAPSGRNCDGCAMCCKLTDIVEIDKPAGVWCPQCVNYQGCGIYETRPNTCRSFFCSYVLDKEIPEHWNPLKSKMVMAFRTGLKKMQISVMVDPTRPDAWRKAPYITDLQSWARGFYIIVCLGMRRYAVLPDHIKEFGEVQDGDMIEFLDDLPQPTAKLRRNGVLLD